MEYPEGATRAERRDKKKRRRMPLHGAGVKLLARLRRRRAGEKELMK